MRMNQKIMLVACVCLLLLVSVASACSISLVKKTNGVDTECTKDSCSLSIPAGTPITWTYDVKNTGDIKVTNVAVTDDKIGSVSCPQTTLNIGESMQCSATGIAAVGLYKNEGKATAHWAFNKYTGDVSAKDKSCYMGTATPKIAIDKVLTNGLEGTTIAAGTSLTWDYTVTNTGNVPLTGVGVTDNKGVVVTCPKTTLAAGESMVCTGTGVAGAAAYTNTGTATGNYGSNPVTTVTASDDSSYTGTANGGSSGSAVPEFPSMALPAAFIVGLLGVVLYIKGTKVE